MRGDRPALRLAGRPPAEHAAGRQRDLRDARQGLHDAAPGRARGPAWHLRGDGVRSRRELPQAARRDRGRAAAGPPHRRRGLPRRPRAHQLLGLQHDRLPRPALALRRHRQGRPGGARVQGHGQSPAQGGDRGDPRRRLQPHRRGQPPRPDAVLPRRRQRGLLPARARRPAPLHGLHGHRQHAQRHAPERAAADHGLAALLGDRLPRRRVPLRSGLRPGPRALRRRPAERVLRRHPPGPRAEPGQADRGAVGRRPGRLPGRQLPRAVVGVERHLPRHDARLLARRGARRRVRAAPDRLERPLPGRRPPPVRVDQLHHRPRRLPARRPRLLQRQAQRGQQGGQPRRDRRQPVLELRCRRADRRPRDPHAARPPAAQLPGHAAALPGHADAARRRRVRPHAGRQQQRLVPGLRGLLVRLVAAGDQRGPARVHPQADRAAARARGLPPAPVPVRARDRGLRPARRGLVQHGRRADARRGLGRRAAGRRRLPQRRGDRLARLARAPGARRVVPAAVQRPPRGPRVHAAREGVRRALDGRARHRGRRRESSELAAGDEIDLVHHSLVLLRRVSE